MNIQVYSANVGQHDPAREADFPILTDDIMGNPLLSARFYKCCPHILYPEADWTIWIDSNVFLHKPPEFFVELTMRDPIHPSYGLFAHYFRNNAYEEYEAELQAKYEDNPERLRRTMDRYAAEQIKSIHLSMDFIFVRQNNWWNGYRNAKWWMEICYGSRRDQLSLEMFYPGPYWPTVDFTKPNEFFTRVSE